MDFEEKIDKNGYCLFDLTAKSISKHPIETKYNAIALCDSGEAILELNMQRVNIAKGTRLMVTHVIFSQAIFISEDFHATILVVSDRFWLDMSIGIPTKMIEASRARPIGYIGDPNQWTIFSNFMENIRIYDSLEYSAHSVEWVGAIFRCMIITAAEIELHNRAESPSANTGYTMADTYFRQFISHIDDNVKQEHEVAFYAEKLHITPKYLSEICKQRSGHKAKEIISSILISKIKREIMITGKSMKVIAYEYNFADQSSLGKFFRKMTGESPSAYKKKKGTFSPLDK